MLSFDGIPGPGNLLTQVAIGKSMTKRGVCFFQQDSSLNGSSFVRGANERKETVVLNRAFGNFPPILVIVVADAGFVVAAVSDHKINAWRRPFVPARIIPQLWLFCAREFRQSEHSVCGPDCPSSELIGRKMSRSEETQGSTLSRRRLIYLFAVLTQGTDPPSRQHHEKDHGTVFFVAAA